MKKRFPWTRIDPNLSPADYDAATMAKIKSRCRILENGCWEYLGTKNQQGYGFMNYRGKPWALHRLTLTIAKGPIPPKHKACHNCDFPPCCNPDHLNAETDAENTRQSVERGRHSKIQNTHCPAGHSFADHGRVGETTGWRTCGMCLRIKYRLRAGWPLELAQSVPRQRGGSTPISNSTWRQTRLKRVRVIKTHCLREHELAGENLYITPGGRRQCRSCHHEAVKRFKPKPPTEATNA